MTDDRMISLTVATVYYTKTLNCYYLCNKCVDGAGLVTIVLVTLSYYMPDNLLSFSTFSIMKYQLFKVGPI